MKHSDKLREPNHYETDLLNLSLRSLMASSSLWLKSFAILKKIEKLEPQKEYTVLLIPSQAI